MLNVVVLNWFDYLSRGAIYVERMRNMVSRHLDAPHEFIVITEKDLTSSHTGWFCKIDLFEMFDGDVFYIDLDCVISRNVDHLVRLGRTDRTKIWARDDWSYPVTNPMQGREATINSSVMFWSGRKDMRGADALIPETHGDQGILTQLFWPNGIALFPNDSIASWKYDAMQDRGYGDICVCHGEPKPHQLLDHQWVRDHWR